MLLLYGYPASSEAADVDKRIAVRVFAEIEKRFTTIACTSGPGFNRGSQGLADNNTRKAGDRVRA
jgi:hypothetical protein